MSYREELLSKTRSELAAIAMEYELEVGRKNKNDIVEDIIRFETGVPEDVEISEPEPEPAPVQESGDLYLVRFTGLNRTFQVGDHVFGVEHPFLAVSERVANHVYRTWPKLFRPATPVEVEQYYG